MKFIVDGDMSTGHDGFPPQRVHASSKLKINGKSVAVVGDRLDTHCKPDNGCHGGSISTGHSKFRIGGKSVAVSGSQISCSVYNVMVSSQIKVG